MSLVHTTLAAAATVNDTSIVVTLATGFSANFLVRVDDENMRIASSYVSGTTIPVIRGQDGSAVRAHGILAGVVCGVASDWGSMAVQTASAYPIAGRARLITSLGATGSVTLPPPGSDLVVILSDTTAFAATVPVPTKDLDGTLLWIASNGVAAHTVTFTGGVSGASTNYDVLTINATAPVVLGPFMAVNSLWQAPVAVPMAGNVASITATMA